MLARPEPRLVFTLLSSRRTAVMLVVILLAPLVLLIVRVVRLSLDVLFLPNGTTLLLSGPAALRDLDLEGPEVLRELALTALEALPRLPPPRELKKTPTHLTRPPYLLGACPRTLLPVNRAVGHVRLSTLKALMHSPLPQDRTCYIHRPRRWSRLLSLFKLDSTAPLLTAFPELLKHPPPVLLVSTLKPLPLLLLMLTCYRPIGSLRLPHRLEKLTRTVPLKVPTGLPQLLTHRRFPHIITPVVLE